MWGVGEEGEMQPGGLQHGTAHLCHCCGYQGKGSVKGDGLLTQWLPLVSSQTSSF
jgi:hypothetical protein